MVKEEQRFMKVGHGFNLKHLWGDADPIATGAAMMKWTILPKQKATIKDVQRVSSLMRQCTEWRHVYELYGFYK